MEYYSAFNGNILSSRKKDREEASVPFAKKSIYKSCLQSDPTVWHVGGQTETGERLNDWQDPGGGCHRWV